MERKTQRYAKTKTHIPAPGKTGAFTGSALCGRWSQWPTGDHDLLRRQAVGSLGTESQADYCAACVRRLNGGRA